MATHGAPGSLLRAQNVSKSFGGVHAVRNVSIAVPEKTIYALIGPVIGAIVLTFLPELLRGFGESRLMIYGLALTLVVLFMPGGIVQAWLALRARFA